MKKMSDVFDLPLCAHDDCLIESSGNRCSEFDLMEQAEQAAHAINHVDALVEAFESIVTDYNQYRALNGIDLTDDHNAKLDIKMTVAEAALAAYRGEA